MEFKNFATVKAVIVMLLLGLVIIFGLSRITAQTPAHRPAASTFAPSQNIIVTAKVYADAVVYASARDEHGEDVVLSERDFNRAESAATKSWLKNGKQREFNLNN